MQEIGNYYEEGFIGTRETYMAMKNEGTYFIETVERGYKLIKDSIEVYSEKVGEDELGCSVYATPLDCFLFFLHDDKIYRKDLNQKPPSLFMDLSSLDINYCFDKLFVSPINKRLFAVSYSQIMIINLEQKRVEIRLDQFGQDFFEFCLFGSQHNNLVVTTLEGGYVSLFIFNCQMRKLVRHSQYKIDLAEDGRETVNTLAVSDQNDHLYVEVWKDFEYCSKMIIFEVKDEFW